MIDYTDPDTIARQNIAPNAGCNIDGKFYDVRNLVHLASLQADHIEELTAKLRWVIDERDATFALMLKRTETAEAKLEKADDVIDWALICWDDHNKHGYDMQGDWVSYARSTLAEIRGESHD